MDVGSTVPVTAPQPTDARLDRSWAPWLRAAAVPVLVVVPLLGAAPKADNRFNPYRFGGEYADRPWHVVTEQVASIPGYLERGNFRPLGRMLERSLDLSTYLTSTAFTLPMNVALRLVHLVAVAVLTIALLVLVETVTAPSPLRRTPLSTASLLVPFAFAAGLVAAGSLSTVVMFTDLYFLSTALVLAVASGAARYGSLTRERLSLGGAALAVVVGAALASFNEVTYLAPPLALVAVVARGRLTLALPWRALVRSAAVKALVLGWLGFLVVLVPIRFVIARNCADGSCYDNSAIAVGPELLPALWHRLTSWQPVSFYRGVANEFDLWVQVRNPVTLLLVLALAYLASGALREVPHRRPLARREVAALALLGGAILVLGASMAATSEAVQRLVSEGWSLGSGWRETQLTVAGASLLVVAGAQLLAVRRPRVTTVGVVGLAVLAATTLVTNQGLAQRQAADDEAVVHNAIAVAVNNFVDDDAGDALRCRLFEDFVTMYPDRDEWHTRLERALDAATQARYSRDFCTAEVRP
jgi:hypothetical protein